MRDYATHMINGLFEEIIGSDDDDDNDHHHGEKHEGDDDDEEEECGVLAVAGLTAI